GKDVSHILPILGLYGFAAYRILPAAQNIYRAISQIKFSSQILKVVKPEFELQKEEDALNVKQDLTFEKSIRLENISFSYPNRPDQEVLKNFSLEVPKNSSLGIMGKSGSGKSTLMDIMLGLLTPQQGQILVDGIALTEQN